MNAQTNATYSLPYPFFSRSWRRLWRGRRSSAKRIASNRQLKAAATTTTRQWGGRAEYKSIGTACLRTTIRATDEYVAAAEAFEILNDVHTLGRAKCDKTWKEPGRGVVAMRYTGVCNKVADDLVHWANNAGSVAVEHNCGGAAYSSRKLRRR